MSELPEESVEESTSPKLVLPKEDEELRSKVDFVGPLANNLVQNSLEFTQLVSVMLASRQLYAMAVYELDRLVDVTDWSEETKFAEQEESRVKKGESLPDDVAAMLKEVLINSSAVQAHKAFDERDLFNGMMTVVFPWMQRVVELHNELQQKQAQAQFDEMNKQRIATPLKLGVQWFPESVTDSGAEIDRNKPVLLVGHEPAVRWVIDAITEQALTEDSNVNQILRLNSGGKPKHASPELWDVSKNTWGSVLTANNSFMRFYTEWVAENLKDPVDLLICDDLLYATSGDAKSSVLTPHNTLNEGQRKLKNWAKEAGCLLISCSLLDRQLEPNELQLDHYSTLKTHNILRAVEAKKLPGVEGEPACYEITIGTHKLGEATQAELDAYMVSPIITHEG